MSSFLAAITEAKRAEMALVSAAERSTVRAAAFAKRAGRPSHVFREALANPGRVNIIAEVKRSSPSAGAIRPDADPVRFASLYAAHGAAAISVLTEPVYFSGSLDDLRSVCAAVSCPALRKDFIVDAHQVLEAAAAGAEAVLLIVAALAPAEIVALRTLAEDELGMDALVEVHAESRNADRHRLRRPHHRREQSQPGYACGRSGDLARAGPLCAARPRAGQRERTAHRRRSAAACAPWATARF